MARKKVESEDNVVRPPSDAYTGLLALSLIAMIASCVVLYLDYAQYGNIKAPAPTVPPVSKPAATTGMAAPNLLAVIPSEPLAVPVIQPIVPVGAETSTTGPDLTAPN